MKLITIEIKKDQELIAALETAFRELGYIDGVILSLFGAVDICCISNMNKDDAFDDIKTTYEVPMEFQGTGEILKNKAHIHCVISQQGDQAIAGHLHWAEVSSWYIKAHIAVIQ